MTHVRRVTGCLCEAVVCVNGTKATRCNNSATRLLLNNRLDVGLPLCNEHLKEYGCQCELCGRWHSRDEHDEGWVFLCEGCGYNLKFDVETGDLLLQEGQFDA